MRKVDCPCRTCTHHGEPKCTHTAECYHGEEYAAWEAYMDWKRECERAQNGYPYTHYKHELFIGIERRKRLHDRKS